MEYERITAQESIRDQERIDGLYMKDSYRAGTKKITGDGMKRVLDVCCGSRMFWFDKIDDRAVFLDRRVESHLLTDMYAQGGKRKLEIRPDIQADFTHLPFPSDHFSLVIFDPPHFEKNGKTSWLNLKYGTLEDGWKDMLHDGFSECFRVLTPNGTLIFKWNSTEIPLSKILKLTKHKPIVGHKSGKHNKTHWVSFIK